MPPAQVKTLRDLIFWQYAKLISESAGFGKKNYKFIGDRFNKLKSGEIEWSTSIREWVHEKETPNQCIYCGAKGKVTVDHMIPTSRGGPDHPDNAVWVCGSCNSSKGDKRLYEFYGLDSRNEVPRIAEGKYLKLLYTELEKRGLLDIDRANIKRLCQQCDLGRLCPEKEELTVYCLEGVFNK
jgi:5-methylcytosine-specific restriction endonuclease McrA